MAGAENEKCRCDSHRNGIFYVTFSLLSIVKYGCSVSHTVSYLSG